MLRKQLAIITVIIFMTIGIGCTTTKYLPPQPRTPAVTLKDLTPRPKLKPPNRQDFDKMPLGFIGELEEYMIGVEGGFDERDMAIEALVEQLQNPVPVEPKKEDTKSWYQFWK